MDDARTDDELLARTSSTAEAFGVFYERHEDLVLAYMVRRVRHPELAADLCAETFAQALISAHRYEPGPAPAAAWLLGIARNVLRSSHRRGRVEDEARRRLGMEPVVLEDEDLARVIAVDADPVGLRLLASLPQAERDAVTARVLAEGEYQEIAETMRCSESVVRKRVSRGLARLRVQLEEKP